MKEIIIIKVGAVYSLFLIDDSNIVYRFALVNYNTLFSSLASNPELLTRFNINFRGEKRYSINFVNYSFQHFISNDDMKYIYLLSHENQTSGYFTLE